MKLQVDVHDERFVACQLPMESTAHITDATAAVTALREAIAGNRPNQAEALLLKALELEAPRDELLSAIMEQGVPRHVVGTPPPLRPRLIMR